MVEHLSATAGAAAADRGRGDGQRRLPISAVDGDETVDANIVAMANAGEKFDHLARLHEHVRHLLDEAPSMLLLPKPVFD